jgi:hypothetical protein
MSHSQNNSISLASSFLAQSPIKRKSKPSLDASSPAFSSSVGDKPEGWESVRPVRLTQSSASVTQVNLEHLATTLSLILALVSAALRLL